MRITEVGVAVPISQIYPHPENPRKHIGDISELSESIKQNGILQNLTVIEGHYKDGEFVPSRYTCIIGHRRLAAARAAGLTEVPCNVALMTRQEQISTMLLENIQRADLTVYEQAQGFQMMIDLGCTVEEISEKSGFSQTTVRRRIKMAELDQKTLEEVSGRQLSLTDFDKLAQIEDINERNAVLTKIGTNDFGQSMSMALRRQATNKNKPIALAWLQEHKSKEIAAHDTWSEKYERIANIDLEHLGEDVNCLPDVKPGEKLFHVFEYYGLRIFKLKAKAPVKKRPQEEIDKEKAIMKAREDYLALSEQFYLQRKSYIDECKPSQKDVASIMYSALLCATLGRVAWSSPDRKEIDAIFEIPGNTFDTGEREQKVYDGYGKLSAKGLLRLTYAHFGDDKTNGFSMMTYKEAPAFRDNYRLRALYGLLTALGYELSTEETEFINGTHPLYNVQFDI